jgi:hypothetical protein
VETHWQTDFGMGYDFIRGAQINFGFRVAEIRSDITATTALAGTITGPAQAGGVATANASLVQTDRRAFFGAGPRLGLVGSVPLIGALTLRLFR